VPPGEPLPSDSRDFCRDQRGDGAALFVDSALQFSHVQMLEDGALASLQFGDVGLKHGLTSLQFGDVGSKHGLTSLQFGDVGLKHGDVGTNGLDLPGKISTNGIDLPGKISTNGIDLPR